MPRSETPAQVRKRLQAQIDAIQNSSASSSGERGRNHDAAGDEDGACCLGAEGRRAKGRCAEGGTAAAGGRPAQSPDAGGDKGPEAAFQRIVGLAARREQASRLLLERLIREGYPPDAAAAAIERAQACGLISDLRYGDALVRARLAQGRGRAGILRELEQLGIEAQRLQDAFCDVPEDEIERALSLLGRRPPTAKNVRESAYRRLVQKGYGAEVAASAARLWAERCGRL